MFALFILMATSAVAMEGDLRDPAIDQIAFFKNSTNGPIGQATLSSGAAGSYIDTDSTLNKPLLRNQWYMDTLTLLLQERTPERIVHAKGAGAFGYFKVTHDISHICKASFLKMGKETPIAVRFSTSVGERGTTDFVLDARGFALKFYTDEGNFDLVGFNTPMYLFKDPLLFHTVVHAERRNPATNVLDPNMLWDTFTAAPETLHIIILLFSGRGIPASYRKMPGFGIHTYQVVNANGSISFCRFHIEPNAGIENLTPEQAAKLTVEQPDFLTLDLYRAISYGDFPSWTVSVQIVTECDVKEHGSIMFDVTQTLPKSKWPLHPVGQLVLNRNPKNFFAEIEQLGFCPGHLVPGIIGAPDKLFEARILAYTQALNHRLGGNFNKIPVNCPLVQTLTYNRDGVPLVGDNDGAAPNYYPNSFNGPVPSLKYQYSNIINIIEEKANNLFQAGELYAKEMTPEEQTQVVENMSTSLKKVIPSIRQKALEKLTLINCDLGNRIAEKLERLCK